MSYLPIITDTFNTFLQENCGRVGHVCHENDGVASCVAGFCKLACDIGFVNKNGICVETKASRKERLHMPLTLCPSGET